MVKSDNYSVNMGNTQDKNDDFSKKANFDIHQHTQAMRNLQSNYTNSGYRINQPNLQSSARVTETEFRSVRRTASIYKPSVNIVPRIIVSTLSPMASNSNYNTIAIVAASFKSTSEFIKLTKISSRK
jgi:hypothetical protein